MSATRDPADAFTYAKAMVKGCNLVSVQTEIEKSAISMLWNAAPWRWTVAQSNSFAMTSGGQDYAYTYPSEFVKFIRGYISNGKAQQDLKPVASLAISTTVGMPSFFSTDGGAISVRIDNLFPTLTGETWTWHATYKKKATYTLAAASLGFDDEYFWIYCEAVLYWAYKFADDDRAGGAQVIMTDKGPQISYTGHLATVMAAIEWWKQQELLLQAAPDPYTQLRIG